MEHVFMIKISKNDFSTDIKFSFPVTEKTWKTIRTLLINEIIKNEK